MCGPLSVEMTTEPQVHVMKSGQPTAYFYSNDNDWGLFSSSGGAIIAYSRATGKTLVGGIDTSTIVRNNSGTYDINISASAAKLNGQTASYYTDIPARLGYTPVQQGTGIGQSANAVKIGWSGSAKLKATVDNTDLGNIAFETWVAQQLANLVASSPASLDTLNELAAALGNDPNFATTIVNALAGKASKAGDTFSGAIAIASASEAQVQVARAGFDTAYLFSNGSQWGLYSASGGLLVGYNRANGKAYFAGIDSSEIVRNNNGTYSINIAGNADSVTNITAAQVLAAIADASAGDVGTYVFGTINGGGIEIGTVYAGSSIIPSGVYHTSPLGFYTAGSGNSSALVTGGGYLSGSWRAMGTENHNTGTQYARATLFLRIA